MWLPHGNILQHGLKHCQTWVTCLLQEVFVTISLGRQLLGVVLNIIVPTIVLNLISYSTNFYKDEYFETVIAINLTTMLVIVTLFVSVSQFGCFFTLV